MHKRQGRWSQREFILFSMWIVQSASAHTSACFAFCVDFAKVCSFEMRQCIDVRCYERENESWCYGNEVHYCQQGDWFSYDCASLESTCDDGDCLVDEQADVGIIPSEEEDETKGGCRYTPMSLTWCSVVLMFFCTRRRSQS